MSRLIQKFAVTTVIFLALSVIAASPVAAQMMGQGIMGNQGDEVETGEHESLDEVMATILSKYEKQTIQELSCDDLTDEDFERVGDGLMESMHPGEAHEAMDAMMGGEGSESLKLMHIQMGQRYLGCDTSTTGGWGMGMMGPMMMFGGGGMMGGGSMMGSQFAGSGFNPLGSLYSLLGVITWILIIFFLVAGIRWFWKNTEK